MDSEIADDYYYIYVCLAMKGSAKNVIRMRKDTMSIKKKNIENHNINCNSFSSGKLKISKVKPKNVLWKSNIPT